MSVIEISDLRVCVEDKVILSGLNLTINAGEVHAIMGPNGSGKSTLGNVIAGREDYQVVGGAVKFLGEDVSDMDAHERSAAGIFLAFQYPVEIPGVTTMNFLKTSLEAHHQARDEAVLTTPQFMQKVRAAAARLSVDNAMLRRPLNVGFSGGEKKRSEILQMDLLQPKLCVLDETDSGLDIDALRVVASGVNAMRSAERGFLVITHYQRLLDYIEPDFVHVMVEGKIVASGGKELALELERNGYAKFIEEHSQQG